MANIEKDINMASVELKEITLILNGISMIERIEKSLNVSIEICLIPSYDSCNTFFVASIGL